MGTPTPIENYERSYRSMWDEINRARAERDAARVAVEAGTDLAIAVRHDIGTGTKFSEPVMTALTRIFSQ